MRTSRLPALLLGLTCVAAFAGPNDRDRDRDRDGDRRGPDRPRVTFYEHADFGGASFTLEAGQDAENLTRMNFFRGPGANDRISSIRIEGGATVLVYRDAYFRGGVLRLTHDVRSLARSERDWNDAISSIRVEGFRGGPPGPSRADWERYDKIIDRLYREILRRDPDETGRRDYRRHMMEDRWTEQQVRESLLHSDEYRKRPRPPGSH